MGKREIKIYCNGYRYLHGNVLIEDIDEAVRFQLEAEILSPPSLDSVSITISNSSIYPPEINIS